MENNSNTQTEAKEAKVVPAIFKTFGIEDNKAKTSMASALEFLNSLKGKQINNDLLTQFATKFATKTTRTSSGEGKPREATKLYDKAGNLIGGKCRATGQWFKAEVYNFHHGLSKEADKLNNRLNAEARKIEEEAKKLLDSARDEENAQEKLKLFEKYDNELNRAKQVKQREIKIEHFESKIENFDTVEKLAKNLQVEVITTKAVKED